MQEAIFIDRNLAIAFESSGRRGGKASRAIVAVHGRAAHPRERRALAA